MAWIAVFIALLCFDCHHGLRTPQKAAHVHHAPISTTISTTASVSSAYALLDRTRVGHGRASFMGNRMVTSSTKAEAGSEGNNPATVAVEKSDILLTALPLATPSIEPPPSSISPTPQSVDPPPFASFYLSDMKRFYRSLDLTILKLYLPAVLNFMILPLVGAVDTFFVGRMNNALALAGQGAANQIFGSVFFLLSFLPAVVSPLIAQATAGGASKEEIQNKISEAWFIGTVISLIGTMGLFFFPGDDINTMMPHI
jgi:MatE